MWPWLSCHYCCYCGTKQHPSKSHKTVSHSEIIWSILTQCVTANNETEARTETMTVGSNRWLTLGFNLDVQTKLHVVCVWHRVSWCFDISIQAITALLQFRYLKMWVKNGLMSPTLFEIKRLCSKVVTGALQDTTGNPNQHQNLLSQFVTHTVSRANTVTLLAANWLPHKWF